MKNKDKSISISALSKQLGDIKINNKIPPIAHADFYKKKMERGAKTLASCPLPK